MDKISWWRRRELNPRPRKPAMKSLRAYPIQKFRTPLQNRQERRRSSPIGSRPTAPDRSLQPIPQHDAHSPPRGLSGWSGYLIRLGGVCKLRVGSYVFRSFYGSSEPGTPPHHDSIPSNPLRPPFRRTPDEDTSLQPG